MSGIKLDPRKLLGFKIIARGESTLALQSPKIGGKQCQVIDADTGALRAKVGTKE